MSLKVDTLSSLDAVQLLWSASQAQLGNHVYMQGLVYRCIQVRGWPQDLQANQHRATNCCIVWLWKDPSM